MNATVKTALTLAVAGMLSANVVNAENVIDATQPTEWDTSTWQSTVSYTGVGKASLTSNTGNINFDETFDGSPKPVSVLDLVRDGIGITNDEVSGAMLTGGQTLTVSFENPGTVLEVFFLDLYVGTAGQFDGQKEEASVSFYKQDNTLIQQLSIQGVETSPTNGGYAVLAANVQDVAYFTMEMTNLLSGSSSDDGTNDAAWAGATVVPIPAAAWLFGSALVGMAGIGYRKKQTKV